MGSIWELLFDPQTMLKLDENMAALYSNKLGGRAECAEWMQSCHDRKTFGGNSKHVPPLGATLRAFRRACFHVSMLRILKLVSHVDTDTTKIMNHKSISNRV